MNVKNFRGKTADECMKKLKSELGSDAVILQSRTIKPLLGRFGPAMHEIVAAADAGAVLDELAEHAGERSALDMSELPTLAPTSRALETQPRLTLSSPTTGNAALAVQPAAGAKRERLTLAEAAQLHEQGAYERLVAAGILKDRPSRDAEIISAAPITDTQRADVGFQLVYASAASQASSPQPAREDKTEPAAENARISQLEQRISLLTKALVKQAKAGAAASAPTAQSNTTSSTNKHGSVDAVPHDDTQEAQSPDKKLPTSAQRMPSVDTPPAAPPETAASSGFGGFLRYRLPAQPAEITPGNELSKELASAPVAPAGKSVKQQAAVTISQTRQNDRSASQSASESLPVNAALPYLNALRASQVAETLLRRLSAELPEDVSPADMRETIHDLLAKRLLIGGAITPVTGKMTLAALLGPTGVGKTTTVAKLAANLKLTTNCRVAMVTLDTSRVAAADQLKGYGEAMGIAVHVAYDKAELESVLMQLARERTQVVLIDTPGRGPLETLSIAEMSQSLRSIVDLRSYVVVPAPLSASNFEHTVQRFIKLARPHALILTKMDETADNHCLGFLLNTQAKYHLPLAYVTMGGRVPDDLLIADAHLLVNKLMAPAV